MDHDHTAPWDDDHDEHRNPTEAFNRRHLLGVAASGFALAASGVLLPEWLVEEAAAREGANGGTLGGRHGKNHKGRHRRRDRKQQHRQNDNRDRAPGLINPLQVALHVDNISSSPVQVQGWEPSGVSHGKNVFHVPTGWDYATLTPNTGGKDFIANAGENCIVRIGTDRLVFASNPPLGFPLVRIQTGGWSADGWNPKGQTLAEQSMLVNHSVFAGGIYVQRLPDTDHKVFVVQVHN